MDEQLLELRDIIRRKSLRVGDFTLSSGKKSAYYLDCRTTTLDPRGALLIGRLILDDIQRLNIRADAIGGLTLGADPIATAVTVVSAIEGKPLPAFIVRKETKDHGTQRFIEGYDGKPGSRVIVVDDVCTTGNSILIAAEKAEQAGYQVVAAFCVVDREEGGTQAIAQKYPFYALLTAKELLKNE
ncbi:MAG: orotate phosphoribosyltransferase [Acidobacteria bacterium]|nr:MAG: orotate phosphoribosyltransferase [Acidobacteriota bacterium]